MRAVVGVLLLLLTAGCGTVTEQAIANLPSTTSSTSTAPTSTVEPTTRAPARAPEPEPDTEDCFDGDCELTLSGPVELQVDPALGFRELSVELSGSDTVLFRIRGDGTSGGGSISGGGRVRFNDLMIEVVSFADDRVTLGLSRVK